MSETRECPFCAEEVRLRAVKCKHCGSSIAPGVCTKCGRENRLEARFCGHCGRDALILLPGKPLAEPEVETPKTEIVRPEAEVVRPEVEPVEFTPVTDKKDPSSGLPLEIRCERDGALMVLIPAGEFWMGSREKKDVEAPGLLGKMLGHGPAEKLIREGGDDEYPRHKVRLDAFYMDRHEVTVAQFRKFIQATGRSMRKQPSWSREDCPVVNVDWNDAKAYCEWAGKSLATEAEWEKAARGETETRYHFGDSEGELGEYAWFSANAGGQAHPVGRKKPNPFGLYDMHGNVWEWVSDWYDAEYYRSAPERNPTGPSSGRYRCLRGGAWDDGASVCRAAYRKWYSSGVWGSDGGFRCVRRQ